MSRYAVGYWSESKGLMLEIDEMQDNHLLNAWRKEAARLSELHRRTTDSAAERILGAGVYDALDAEVKRRGLDKPKPEQPPECSVCRRRHGAEITHPCE